MRRALTQAGLAFTGVSTLAVDTDERTPNAVRVALAPGEKTPAHQHKAPVVVLQDSLGKGVASGPMSFELNEPGQWAFFDTGGRHEIANRGTERLEVIEVEVRRAP